MRLSLKDIKEEMLRFIRNSDVIDKETRNVVTVNFEDDVNNITEYTITDYKNVKNVRVIKINGETLRYGNDYLYQTEEKLKIIFNTLITGELVVSFDIGTDKIFTDYPRDDLSISSYPRISVDIIAINTEPFGIGGKADLSEILFTIIVYSNNIKQVDTILDKIRKKIQRNKKEFFFNEFVRISGIGRLVEAGEHSQIVHRNIDLISSFKLETVDDESP